MESGQGRARWEKIQTSAQIELSTLRAQFGIRPDITQGPNVSGSSSQVVKAELRHCGDESSVMSQAGVSPHPEHAKPTSASTPKVEGRGTDLHLKGVHRNERAELAEGMNRNERLLGPDVLNESAAAIHLVDGVDVLITNDHLVSGREVTLGVGFQLVPGLAAAIAAKIYADGEDHGHGFHPGLTLQAEFRTQE